MSQREREIVPDGRTNKRKGALSLEPFTSVRNTEEAIVSRGAGLSLCCAAIDTPTEKHATNCCLRGVQAVVKEQFCSNSFDTKGRFDTGLTFVFVFRMLGSREGFFRRG